MRVAGYALWLVIKWAWSWYRSLGTKAQLVIGVAAPMLALWFFAEMGLDWAAAILSLIGLVVGMIAFWGAVVWLVKWIFFDPVYFD